MPTDTTNQPRERSIIFSAPMIRAILDGHKGKHKVSFPGGREEWK